MNHYFDLEEPEIITDTGQLLSLNVEKTYYRPGDQGYIEDMLSVYTPHSTAGIFRGQREDRPLIPKCYRGLTLEKKAVSDVIRSFQSNLATGKFWSFCERAELQNPSFPSDVAERMSIAQHFGIPTPLLDWSQNIFAAVFFAIRDVYSDPEEFEHSLRVFVYHIIDERLLHDRIPDRNEILEFDQSAFVKPPHIDRRIERQRGVFTYHPHPTLKPPRIPAKVYVLEWQMIERLIPLMKGFGFTEDYYFPDYAGIAQAVMSETSL